MGNSSSSAGGFVGSMILGAVFAPLTGGLSLVAGSVGAVTSGVALVKNIHDEREVENRTGRKIEFSPVSFAIGLVGGGMMAAGGGLAAAGAAAADISIGVAGVGVGLATSGDNKPKPYVGQQGSGIKQLEDRKNAEQAFKEEVKQIKADDASKLNAAISQADAPQFGDPLQQMQPRLIQQRLLTPTPLPCTKAPNSTVTNIYIIRRNFANIPDKGPIAHSGLLIQTDDNKYYILEYGVESDPNTVTIRPISADSITDKTFADGDHVWDKQKLIPNIHEKNLKAEEVKKIMEERVAALPYHIKYSNCHVAQENTQRKLGLTDALGGTAVAPQSKAMSSADYSLTNKQPVPLPCTKAPNSTITNINVIRRNLAGIPSKGPIAHSALLMQTHDNKYYILEYGVESNQNTVTLRPISADNITDKTLADGDHVWDKQTLGTNIHDKHVKAEEVKKLMEECVAALPYDIEYWNCHVAQENTRRKLGLTVERPYELNPIGSAEFAKRVKGL